MITFTKTKFKKSDDQTNIDKYRVAGNITEYHSISKLIFLTIIILRLRQLFHVTRMTTFIKTKFKNSDDQKNIDKYRVAENITEYQN